MPRKSSEPRYQHHKATGQARTYINGRDHYLGPYNSPESQERFADLVAEWRLSKNVDKYTLTVDDLALRFLEHATDYYRRPDGTPTGTADTFRHALRPLVQLHGRLPIKDFDVRSLKAVRVQMIEAGKSRNYINGTVAKIKQVFLWGKNDKLVPSQVYEDIRDLTGLRAGRCGARESAPVLPVDEGTVNDTLPHLPRVVADMIRLQLLSGARPGEVTSMRPCDIARGTNGVWTYRPASHKTEHHGRERRVFIGPEGQQVLAPYLNRDPDAYCFSPIEAETERNESRRANRLTPMTPSQAARKPKGRSLHDRYTKRSYGKAIQRGCEIAFEMPAELRYVDRVVARMKKATDEQKAAEKLRLNQLAAKWRAQHCWAPNQLRHSRATAIREQFGLEAAQVVLGHADPKITQVYAERDFQMAERIMAEIG